MDHENAKVLLVDDDPALLEVLSDILEVEGIKPIPARSGAAALVSIEQQEIDVALIDIKLKISSGLDVLREIKERSPEIECIMLTGDVSQATAIAAVNLGAYSYLRKPYEVDQLLVTILRAAEKRAVAQKLLASEARFRSLIENSADLICIMNPDATPRYVSPSIKLLLGYPSEEIDLETSLGKYIHRDDHPVASDTFRQCMQNADSAPASLQLRVLHKDGNWRTLEGTARNLLNDPAIEGIIVIVHDITVRMRAEEALEQSREQLHALTAYWQTAIEAERTHIAREIHDEFGQSMTALKMDLSWLARHLPEGDKKAERLKGMNTLVDESISLMRRIATELRPNLLDDLGLNAALDWQAREFSRRTGIPCKLNLPEQDLGLGPALRTSLFRIFQETLTNVSRHAQATGVTVNFASEGQALTLTIRDNGRGITEQEKKDPRALGLLGLNERAAQWGGETVIRGVPGKGTSVTVRIPLPASVTSGGRP